MLMKKMLMMLFGVIFALGASAQVDLQGRKVNLSKARKGIYVVGGKKIMVKK